MDPVNLATPELWVMNAREAEARFWKVCWASLDLEVGCCGREGTLYHHPAPAGLAAPSLLVHQTPQTLLPLPSLPRPAQGHSPGENNAHCDRRLQLS